MDGVKPIEIESRRQHLIDHSSFGGHGINIKPSFSVRLLGVYVDEAMSFEVHIGNVVTTGFFQLRQLKAIRNCIPIDTAKTLVGKCVCGHEVRLL